MRYSSCLVSAISVDKRLHFIILFLCLASVCGCQGARDSYPKETAYDHIGLLRRDPTPQQLERAILEPEPEAKARQTNKGPIAVLLLDSENDLEAIKPGVEPEAVLLIAESAKLLSQSRKINILSNLQWSIQQWSDPGEIILTEDPVQQLRLIAQKGTRGKVSLAAPLPRNFLTEHPLGISASASMQGETILSLACFVQTKKAKEYFESRAILLSNDEKQLVFRLAQPIWKTEQSKWEFTEIIPGDQEIGEIGFVIYDVSAGSEVFLNKIEIILKNEASTPVWQE